MRPPKLTPAGKLEIQKVAMERFTIPTDKDLAYRHNISLRQVQRLMKQVRAELQRKRAQSRETSHAILPTAPSV